MLTKNQDCVLTVTDMNNRGYGVARLDGRVVFVSDGVTGDTVEARIIKVASDYAVAKTTRVVTPSPHRVPSDCEVFGKCGGCAYRHITRSYELSLKEEMVKGAFRKQRLCAEIEPILTDGRVLGYRNKVQYPVGEDGTLGYYARHSHRIVPSDTCLLTDPALTPLAAFASDYIRRSGAKVKHVYLRRGAATGDAMLCFVSPSAVLPDEEAMVREAIERFPNLKSILVNIHPEETNVILGKTVRVLYGTDGIEDILCDCRFFLSSQAFYQVNRGGAELLYREAIARALACRPKKVADLYCGAGTIGISLAKAAPEVEVVGVEIVPQAVENAIGNAARNGIVNAAFLCADAMAAPLDDVDCILLDPPRKGLSEELLARLCRLSPKKIVYVSCEPTTLARDAAVLIAAGYRMGTVRPVDLFPRTGAVECVTDFVKEKESKNEANACV